MEQLSATKKREFKFTRKDFDLIRKVVRAEAGIHLSEAKHELVYNRLAKRVRTLGFKSFAQYCDYIESDSKEITTLINSITTNLTHFFREQHHFDFIINKVIPDLKNIGRRSIRIWSAGCSTGEEPYSLAITLLEALGERNGWDIKILATDVDSSVLTTAQNGVYAKERVEKLPIPIKARWFYKGKGDKEGFVKVNESLKRLITFSKLNLHNNWSLNEAMDMVFCRNVMIYFDKQGQKDIISGFASALKPRGYLVVGHSENLFKVSEKFVSLGKTIYQKLDK